MASILAVDDEPENLELLEAVLTPAGHTIRKATGGREALQAVEQEAPELILLDLMMPGVSGFDVCEMLRANERTARIPIIIVTALDQLPVKERVLSLGADEFVAQPLLGVEGTLLPVEQLVKGGTLVARVVLDGAGREGRQRPARVDRGPEQVGREAEVPYLDGLAMLGCV
ncbi:MAG: response regulator, partial [candidate division NC10 bacterium]